jgi:hypothetical protein
VEQALAAAEGVDLVLCTSIHAGLSGQKFVPVALDRTADLRRLLPADVSVQVDRGFIFAVSPPSGRRGQTRSSRAAGFFRTRIPAPSPAS